MKGKDAFSIKLVRHISELAKIPISDAEEKKLADGFTSVMDVVNKLFKLDVSKVKPASQVTGLENVFREDEIDEKNMLSQEQALSNAPRKHNGFFVVDQILEE